MERPDSDIDGKGSDAGWQEFTLAEIGQGFSHIEAKLAAVTKEKAELQEALKLAMYEVLKVKCGNLHSGT